MVPATEVAKRVEWFGVVRESIWIYEIDPDHLALVGGGANETVKGDDIGQLIDWGRYTQSHHLEVWRSGVPWKCLEYVRASSPGANREVTIVGGIECGGIVLPVKARVPQVISNVLVFSLLIAIVWMALCWVRSKIRRMRCEAVSPCPSCGYEMRGHETHADKRCPECGECS